MRGIVTTPCCGVLLLVFVTAQSSCGTGLDSLTVASGVSGMACYCFSVRVLVCVSEFANWVCL